MPPLKIIRRNKWAAGQLGIMAGLFIALFFLRGAFEKPELGALDVRCRLMGRMRPSPDIVIIGITQKCLEQFGRPPFSRKLYSELLQYLKKAGAKVVALDEFFSGPGPDPAEDQRLADVIRSSGNVILPVFTPYKILEPEEDSSDVQVTGLARSAPAFYGAALAEGHINVSLDYDGVCRRAPVVVKYGPQQFFSEGAVAALKFLGVPDNNIVWRDGFIDIRHKRIPIAASKSIFINFSDSNNLAAPNFAFSDVIDALVPEYHFKNKLVFVGATIQGLDAVDIINTPFKEKYRVAVEADIANTFLGEFYLRRPAKSTTCLWIVLISIAVCLIVIYLRTFVSSLLTIAILLTLCFVSFTSILLEGLILDFVPLTLSIAASFVLGLIYRINFADTMVRAKEMELDSILLTGSAAADSLKAAGKAYDVIMSGVIDAIGAAGLLMRWKNEATGEYQKRYVWGSADSVLAGAFAAAEQALADTVIKSRKPALVKDTRKEQLFAVRAPAADPHSILCAPMLVKSEVAGVITLLDKALPRMKRQVYFDENDLKLFLILTQQIAISIENMRLADELNDMFMNSIKALVETIDAKDPYTRGHSERVTAAALAIADEIALSPKQIKELTLGSILHDIGKIGIKDTILLKPGKLTPEEKEAFNQHSALGAKIMGSIGHLGKIIPIIKYHHEAFDGSGYPEGLEGEQIPLGARILSVADTFDAMTSDRPYRSAFTAEQAAAEIKSRAGKDFDPKIAEAFARAYAKGKIK